MDLYGIRTRKGEQNSFIKSLMIGPKKETKYNMPKHRDLAIEKNLVQQADLLTMPVDRHYKYVLVVVDIGSRSLDARPIKNKEPETVLEAIKSIYKGKYLKTPDIIHVDAGTEFLGAFRKYFVDNNKVIIKAKTNRHRQQAIVERANRTIAEALFHKFHLMEQQNKTPNNEWIHDLPIVIELLNKLGKEADLDEIQRLGTKDDQIERLGKRLDKNEKQNAKNKELIRCNGVSCDMLTVGDLVHVGLDVTTDMLGNKLQGRRATDIKWTVEPKKISKVFLSPDQPPTYAIEGIENTRYTREQLKPVNTSIPIQPIQHIEPTKPQPKPKTLEDLSKDTKKPTFDKNTFKRVDLPVHVDVNEPKQKRTIKRPLRLDD